MQMMKSTLFPALFGALAGLFFTLALSACGTTDVGSSGSAVTAGGTCVLNSDCAAGLECEHGTCQAHKQGGDAGVRQDDDDDRDAEAGDDQGDHHDGDAEDHHDGGVDDHHEGAEGDAEDHHDGGVDDHHEGAEGDAGVGDYHEGEPDGGEGEHHGGGDDGSGHH